jgi:FkbM family methyltransferase
MALYKDFIKRFIGRESDVCKKSYSQCGEDLIVDFVLSGCMNLPRITYLDIGAHHPVSLSNTYLFYQNGSQGVCVEPDPQLFAEIKRVRPRDICLNAGAGVALKTEAEFYRMTTPTLNTFSKEEAERYQAFGNQRIEEVLRIPLLPVNTIIEENFTSPPNFVSLDVEGLDFDILRAFDFSRFRPQVFCVETLTYTENKTEEKLSNIIELMTSNNYFTYADTYINTIFVDSHSWLSR